LQNLANIGITMLVSIFQLIPEGIILTCRAYFIEAHMFIFTPLKTRNNLLSGIFWLSISKMCVNSRKIFYFWQRSKRN